MDADRVFEALAVMLADGRVSLESTLDGGIRCLWSCGADAGEPGLGRDVSEAIGAAWANVKLKNRQAA